MGVQGGFGRAATDLPHHFAIAAHLRANLCVRFGWTYPDTDLTNGRGALSGACEFVNGARGGHMVTWAPYPFCS